MELVCICDFQFPNHNVVPRAWALILAIPPQKTLPFHYAVQSIAIIVCPVRKTGPILKQPPNRFLFQQNLSSWE